MPLPVNFITFGTIKDSGGNPISSANVHCYKTGGSSADTTTDANGKYQVNIKTVVDNGDTVNVRSSGGGENKTGTFILDLSFSFQQIDLTLDETTLSETLSISETLSKYITLTNTETLSFSDSLSKDITTSLTETTGLSDSFSRDIGLSLDETTNLSDILSAGGTISLGETLGMSDSLGRDIGLGITELTGITEAISSGIARDFLETLGMSDSLGRDISINPSDSLNMNDALLRALSITTSETLGFSDSLSKLIGLGLSESLGMSDSLSRLGVELSLADILSFIDSLSTVYTSIIPVTGLNFPLFINKTNEEYYKLRGTLEQVYNIVKEDKKNEQKYKIKKKEF